MLAVQRHDDETTQKGPSVMPPKLALTNLVESLAIYPVEPTCDHMGNYPYTTVSINAKEDE
jgi:hypothetical protein